MVTDLKNGLICVERLLCQRFWDVSSQNVVRTAVLPQVPVAEGWACQAEPPVDQVGQGSPGGMVRPLASWGPHVSRPSGAAPPYDANTSPPHNV